MKYKLLKIIDIAGLNFLSPVVRLIAGENPPKQLREIGRFILVPLLAFAAFIWLWSILAPKHRTKAGEVPTPGVTWNANTGIWLFHDRETAKADAYLMSADERLKELQTATKRLALLGEARIGSKQPNQCGKNLI